ncbi:MAG TPA: helix-turn-helix transcriptional regulator [Thermomicrobiales bacterium]|nr:helix-turn-helix transcriptional regulator [Thermomicrobiales bacterium]
MAKTRSTSDSAQTAGSLLGEWLRSARKDQGLSQRALADRSGLSRSYVCDIERGRGAEPSLTTLDKLAAALGASRADLMRAAGLIDPSVALRESDDERRLLAVFRDLSDTGQLMMMRYARFIHQEEHAWTQSSFVDPSDGSSEIPRRQSGPTLFDLDG